MESSKSLESVQSAGTGSIGSAGADALDDDSVGSGGGNERERFISSRSLALASTKSTSSAAAFDDELRSVCVSKIQSHIRRFVARKRLLGILNNRYEKIYDPIRRRFYYYDTIRDTSTWRKPALFRDHDVLKVAPTYFPEEAAVMIQRTGRRHIARRLVRLLYADTVKVTVDPTTKKPIYNNPKTKVAMNQLPHFMGGKLNHGYRDAAKIKKKYYNRGKAVTTKSKASSKPSPISKKSKDTEDEKDDEDEDEEDEKIDEEGEEDVEDDESDGSELSESSDAVVEKRRQLRNYPR
jgi:hypothetical protein